MNGNDRFLNINDAHLRVTGGNVHASSFNLDQISITTTSTTASTIDFLNETTAFTARSNIEVGTANLFVNTETSNVGIGTDAPEYTLDVHGTANVGVLTASSNVGVGTFSPEYALDVHGTANVGALTATTFSGIGTSLTALNAGNITSGTLDTAHVPSLDASKITGGTLPVSRGGTGTTSSTGSGALVLQNAPSFTGDATFDTNTLKIDAINNRVGIGTTTPGRFLEVYTGDGNVPGIRLRRGTGSAYTDLHHAGVNVPGTGDLEGLAIITSDGNATTQEVMRICGNGNVGIGTSNPGYPLQVDGTIKLSTGTNDASGSEFNIDGTVGHIRRKIGGNGVSYTSYDDHQFYTNATGGAAENGGESMVIKSNGNVGIGTTTPYAKLQVNGQEGALSADSASSFNTWANGGNYDTHNNLSLTGISIHASHDIVSGSYIASHRSNITASDERIKKDIVDLEDGPALETLRLLKPKRYKYKDVVRSGTDPVWGFIAQEVRETLSYATQLRQDSIPNIYEMVNISTDSSVITFTNFDTSTLESGTKVLKVFDESDTEHFITFTEVIDDNSLRIEEDLSKWTQLFVYGQRVDDFVFVQKDAIWTVATAALQEVDRQLQAEKAKVTTLETQLATVLTRLDALENA